MQNLLPRIIAWQLFLIKKLACPFYHEVYLGYTIWLNTISWLHRCITSLVGPSDLPFDSKKREIAWFKDIMRNSPVQVNSD